MQGVIPGMVLSEAQALVGAVEATPAGSTAGRVVVAKSSPDRVARALRRLGEWSLRFAPVVGIDGVDGLLLDIRGCERWMAARGGEPGLLDRIEAAFRRRGFGVRVAIADTVPAARAWCRHARGKGLEDPRILPVGHGIESLDGLPVEGLRLDPVILERLREIRVRSIGELRSLPRMTLPSRYGPAVLLELDRASGRVPVSIDRLQPPRKFAAERRFAGPVESRDVIELAVVELLEAVQEQLRRAGCGARMLRLRGVIPDAGEWTDSVEFARATRRPARLWTVLGPLVERIPLDGGIDAIRLEVPRRGRLRHRTGRMIAGVGGDPVDVDREEDRASFIDAIRARFGPDSVRRFDPAPSHVPEEQNRLSPIAAIEPAAVRWREAIVESGSVPGRRPDAWIDPPTPIDVEARDGVPDRIRILGAELPVVEVAGPEPVGIPWWRFEPAMEQAMEQGDVTVGRRTYWRARVEGGPALWMFHASVDGGWYLQGTWS